MNLKLIHIFLCISTLVLSCINFQKNNLNNFSLFEGTWKMKNAQIFENWKANADFLSGNVIQISESDTTVLEMLKILKIGNNYFYEANVKNQNNGNPVQFKLIKQTGNEFHFNNPKHDFPQNIIYRFNQNSEINITISDSIKSKSFIYEKIK